MIFPVSTLIPLSLLSLLASAAPAPAPSVNLVLETAVISATPGEGDTATVITVPFRQLFNAAAIQKGVSIFVFGGTNVPIANSLIKCQAFSDAAGLHLLGSTFDQTFPGASLSSNLPVQIGAIFCSDAAGVKAKIASVSSAPPKKTSTTTATTRIQLDFSDEGAAQADIPLSGALIPIRGTFATSVASFGTVNSASDAKLLNQVVCQAFSDVAGKNKLGEQFTAKKEGVFSKNGRDVNIGSISCKV